MRKRIVRALLSSYKRYKQKRSDLSHAHALEVAKSLLRKSRYVVLLSNADGLAPSARVVQPVFEDDDNFYRVWIGTRSDSRKIEEIRKNHHVTLVVQNNGRSAQLVLKGRASIEMDDQLRKKHWQGGWRMFFPDGPQSSDYVLLQIVFDELEILSFSDNIIPEPFGLSSLSLNLQR